MTNIFSIDVGENPLKIIRNLHQALVELGFIKYKFQIDLKLYFFYDINIIFYYLKYYF